MSVIDIDRLSEAELVDLNRRILERLRMIQQLRAHQAMLNFSVGQRVAFEPAGRGVLEGMVVRYNRKTVTIVTASGEQWNVAPALLRPAGDSPAAAPSTIIDWPAPPAQP